MLSDAHCTVDLWSLSDDALLEGDRADAAPILLTRWGELVVDDADPLVREALRRMTLGPISLANVTRGSGSADSDTSDLERVEAALERLSGVCVRSLSVGDGLRPLLSVHPAAPAPVFRLPTISPEQPVRLSRFSLLRACEGELAVESARARFRVSLHRQVAIQVASSLAATSTITDIAERLEFPIPVVAGVVAYLAAAGMVLLGDCSRRFAEDDDPALRHWTHHGLTFHARSRSRQGDGQCDLVADGQQQAASPVVKTVPAAQRFALFRPSLTDSASRDALTGLLESDHSCPELSARPLTARQLGELLYRSARIRGPGPDHLPPGMNHEASQRPYVSIACLYELELYVSVARCAGLPRGIYHYGPGDHSLTLVNDSGAELDELLDMAKVSAGCVRQPAVLITMTARMERMAVLGGAAYATTLMHVGALQQTLSLVAKPLGLRAHPVPVDACDAVERALGLDWPAEVGVGECVLDNPDTAHEA